MHDPEVGQRHHYPLFVERQGRVDNLPVVHVRFGAENELLMTALLIIAALFGGLCFAGRRWRQYYVDQYIDNDVDTVRLRRGCASESYDNSSSSGDRDD